MAPTRTAKVLILSSGRVLTALVGVLSIAVLSRLFSKHDYASYRQTLLAFTFAVPFVTLGFEGALYYFLPGEEKRSRGVLVENLLWLLGGGALLSLFLLLGGNRLLAWRFHNPDLAGLLLLLLPYPLLVLPASSLAACLMARNRTEQVAAFQVGSRLLLLAAIVAPCWVWSKPAVAVTGTVAAAALTAGVALVLMFRACAEGPWQPTLAGLRRQLVFSVPLGLAGLVGTIAHSLNQVMVAALCPPEVFAVYINGAMEIPLIGVVTGSVASVVMVDYARFYRDGRTVDIVALIHRAMVKCGLILLPVMVFLLCLAPELMGLLFGRPYVASAVPFRFFLLLLPVRTLTFGAILQATGHSHQILIYAVILLITNALLTWCAIRFLGPLFAAAGSVLSEGVSILYMVLAIQRILRCSLARLLPWKDMAKVAGASLLGAPFVLAVKGLGHAWPDAMVLGTGGVLFGIVTLAAFSWLRLVDLAASFRWAEFQVTRTWRA